MVKIIRAVVALAACVATTVAAGAWEITADEDPMTDKKAVYIGVASNTSSVLGAVVIGFKCWQGEPGDTLLFVGTTQNYDADASHNSVRMKFRADRASIFELELAPINLGGKLVLAANQELNADVLKFLKTVESAKSYLAVASESAVYKFDASGSKAAVQRMIDDCQLQLSE